MRKFHYIVKFAKAAILYEVLKTGKKPESVTDYACDFVNTLLKKELKPRKNNHPNEIG